MRYSILSYQYFHLPDREDTAVQAVLRALAGRRVGAVEDVAEFVGEVGQDLEADGRQDDEDGRPDIDLEIGRSEEDAQQDAARGEGQRAEPHGRDGGAELIHRQTGYGSRTAGWRSAGSTRRP